MLLIGAAGGRTSFNTAHTPLRSMPSPPSYTTCMPGTLAEIASQKKKIVMKTLSTMYKGERVVELFEDINLPKDMAVLVVIPEQEDEKEADIDEMVWLRAAAANTAFDFLKEPEEDIYTLADGRPFCDPG